ncbi:MAG: cysteine synthase A [Ruminococcus sp.]|uniref:cysteine synthase A n=1 Tax=Ruminococcus sp. TaxID=41978 RepID=UPI0025F90E94|nr:cysteine synthase A [Ruminococcus sp.]MBO4865310.1 cysteine synthase A [Ruminococcus sp.]
MSKVAENLTELIGNTPLLKISRLAGDDELYAEVYAKLEYFNPLGSVKDRIALAMIEDAEEKGLLKEGYTIIEPTSGNTGIGLAFVGAVKGYKVILTMPESMSIERRRLVTQLGAKVILTPAADGMKGAIRKAEELNAIIEDSFIPQQFDNPVNPEVHTKTTAQEIISDTDGKVDYFVAGVGTGGTVTGTGKALKQNDPDTKVIAVEPYDSSVLSGEAPGPHVIQGIGAGFVPHIFDRKVIDEIFRVKNKEALETARTAARLEGLLVGISSGAALFAAIQLAKRKENKGKRIVVLLPDTGERYLSTTLFDQPAELA